MTTVRKIREGASALGASTLFVVFGSSVSSVDDDEILERALSHVALTKSALINGGYMGTMAATAFAVRCIGGVAIGVPCGNLDDPISLESFDAVIPASCHWDRLKALVEIADAFIVLPGGVGTAVEVAALLWSADRGFVNHRPVLFIGDHWERWIDEMSRYAAAYRDLNTMNTVSFAKTPLEVDEFFKKISIPIHNAE